MSYQVHYKITDDIIAHLDPIIKGISDSFISSRYVGLIATAAITSYELAIKSIFIRFAGDKHIVLKSFVESYFGRLNGRIKTSDVKGIINKFGQKYGTRFDKKIDIAERQSLITKRESIISCYNNIIEWRHKFVHEGIIPVTATYNEAVKSYYIGKELIRCIDETMHR